MRQCKTCEGFIERSEADHRLVYCCQQCRDLGRKLSIQKAVSKYRNGKKAPAEDFDLKTLSDFLAE